MGDSANWEFAAVVAAVCIGLGGLLVFTLIGALGAWRVHDAASNAAAQAARAAAAIEELARSLIFATTTQQSFGSATPVAGRVAESAAELERLRGEAGELLRQQEALSETVRNLVQAGVLGGDQTDERLRALEQTLRRVEEQLVRITTPGPR